MATYTQLSAAELTEIANRYGIKMTRFEPVEGGNCNSNYLLHAEKNKYILTLIEEKKEDAILKFIKLVQWLNQNQFPTSEFCVSITGDILMKYKEKPVLIKKWITGKVIEDLNEEQLGQAGKALAKLHELPTPSFLSKSNAYGIDAFEEVLNKNIDADYDCWLKEQLILFKETLPLALPKGLIHADLFFDNVLFENSRLKAIIDFEEACDYYLMFDIGMAIVGMCREEGILNLEKAKAWIKGYETIRSFTSLEKEYLSFFVEYAATSTSRWRFRKYNIDKPSPNLKNHHWKMVRVAKQVKRLGKEKFMLSVFGRG